MKGMDWDGGGDVEVDSAPFPKGEVHVTFRTRPGYFERLRHEVTTVSTTPPHPRHLHTSFGGLPESGG